jgi:hypothetical protein
MRAYQTKGENANIMKALLSLSQSRSNKPIRKTQTQLINFIVVKLGHILRKGEITRG